MRQIGLYDELEALGRLSKLGDKLEWLNGVMDWRMFEALINEAKPDKTKTEKGGRPPYSNIMMFKILVLQSLYNVADDQAEYQINDRLTWKRFLGLTLSEKSPDAKTIWEFREILTNSGILDELFKVFTTKMAELGVITRRGSIVDASFEDAPRQRNTREENKKIKDGEIPEGWENAENAHMFAQKDLDARWAEKNDELHYGYKNHIASDADSKMIVDFRVTSANVHDSQVFVDLLDGIDPIVWADSAYTGEARRALLERLFPGIDLQINEKGYKNKPLTVEQKAGNREKSKTRARVEHIFASMAGTAKGFTVRCIGILRAEFVIGMRNLAYNISRYETLRRLKKAPKIA
jgi:IS5 family transposase